MAIRYSGDVEVRMGWEAGVVRGSVTDGEKPHKFAVKFRKRPSPDDYDRISVKFLSLALAVVSDLPADVKNGRIQIRRIYQAPCESASITSERGRRARLGS
jgi:hypothetical protein